MTKLATTLTALIVLAGGLGVAPVSAGLGGIGTAPVSAGAGTDSMPLFICRAFPFLRCG